ncbi:porin [Siphonobacter aquaeclarae]|uniref:Putative beta-barrel porin-2, OmpL-like. bbp2 n=1 Tax=Siphonobacter aquaeclarae TaxID=563176 RepID=A0A1G9RWH9_9BACT|nr:porin [Siphonobacter aquaeclarae]SDM27648.1 Putative beta-barrel porin-2, OmpL-like. bbp2 [Siphonobacter aquaeclarae]
MKKAVISIFSLFCVTAAFAEVSPESKEKPKTKKAPVTAQASDDKKSDEKTDEGKEKKEEGEKGKITFSGYLDTYYMANLNNPASRSNLGTSGLSDGTPTVGNARAFDQKSGQFSLGLIQTKVAYTSDKLDAVADLTFGPNADLGNYGNAIGPLGGNSTALAIKQMYLTYKFSPKFSITAGQFGTHIGYEVIDAPVNYNYSLSNLFNNGPFYHIGAKAQYSFSDKAYLMAGVVNNIDALNDNNKAKAIISQFFFSPATNWNVYINWIGSNEVSAVGKTPSGNFYSLFDLTTTYQITEKFYMGLNAAYGTNKTSGVSPTPKWGGAAIYSNYAFTPVFGLGVRYEYFDNKKGDRAVRNGDGLGTSVNSLTITGNFTLADGHLLLKPEFRLDSYPKVSGSTQKFEDSDGKFTKSSQSTLGLIAIVKF